jgi:hypothetical protein
MAGKLSTCSNDRDAQIKDIFGRHIGFSHGPEILVYVDVGINLVKQANGDTRL